MENPTAAEVPDVLRAHRIEVVDGDGRVRAVLGRLPNHDAAAPPVYGASLLDADGEHRAWLVLLPTGPSLSFDLGGNQVLELGVDDATADAVRVGAYLYLNGPDGSRALGWHVDADGSVSAVDGRARR